MQIVPTSALAVLAVLIIAWAGPRRGLWAFSILTPFGAAAAVNLPALGGASILLADLAAVALFAALLAQRGAFAGLLASVHHERPGFLLLALFAFSVFATLFFPRIFSGATEVFAIARIEGSADIILRPLRPTNGNITQLFRLALGVMTFLTLAAVFRREPDPHTVVVAFVANAVVHCALGVADVLSYSAGVSHWLEPIRTANYAMAVNQVMAGLKRMVGGFPEASAFGYHTMGLFGFWLQYWFDGGRFRASIWLLLAVAAVLVLSTSTSAYVSAALFLLIFLIVNARRFLHRRVNLRVAVILGALAALTPVVLAALVVAYQTVPEIAGYFDRMLFNKLSSGSGVERMSWNAQALRNFVETGLMGAGLGSVRASNWFLACLGSIGLIGTALFLAFLVSVFRATPHAADAETAIVVRALRMGCIALLAPAMVTKATPNLELIFFAMAGLIAGLVAGADRQATPRRSEAEVTSGGPSLAGGQAAQER